MRSGVLLDTGPLVAYLTERDAHHERAVEAFSGFDPPAITCEPVLTEACFLVARNGQTATLVLDYALESEIRLGLQLEREMEAIRTLMRRFANVPMSLYQLPVKATHVGDSQSEADVIHRGKRVGVCHGCGDWGSRGL